MRIKICGLTTVPALEVTITSGADMAGFVFFDKSPRHLQLEQARQLGAIATGRITKVALVVDAGDDLIAQIVQALQPDMLQLHGSETPQRIAEIRSKFDLPVMKAYGISTGDEILSGINDGLAADILLFDAKPPKGASLPGGNGLAFDWKLLAGLDVGKPWMLSGGLNPENVAQAIALTGAPGVDVSSGVESAPGVKDAAKIARFIAQARL